MRFDSITLKQLRAFEAYVREGTVVKAALALGVTPPAITIQIKALEAIAGASMYNRFEKKIRLTDTGKRVYELAITIARFIESAGEDLENIRYARMGKVRLGIVTTAKYIVPIVLAGFKKQNPEISVALYVGNRTTVMEWLQEGAIDLAITGRPSVDFVDTSARICDHPYVIVSSIENPLVRQNALQLTQLQRQEFLLREQGSGSRALMETVFSGEGFSISKIGLEADSNETIKQGVMAGLGIAFISAHTIYQEVATNRIVVLDIKKFPIIRAWYVVGNKNVPSTAATAALQNFIVDQTSSYLPTAIPNNNFKRRYQVSDMTAPASGV